MNWSSTDWLILRPLLVVAIVWATVVVGLIAAWIHKHMTAGRDRALSDSAFPQLAPAGTQVTRGGIDSGSPPPPSTANGCESRAA